MEVSEEVAEMFKEFDRKEAAYRLRTYRHKAYYSLDRDDGLEHEALFVALSPHELYERKVTMQELHAAIASLPNKQAKRIYAHFIHFIQSRHSPFLLNVFFPNHKIYFLCHQNCHNQRYSYSPLSDIFQTIILIHIFDIAPWTFFLFYFA